MGLRHKSGFCSCDGSRAQLGAAAVTMCPPHGPTLLTSAESGHLDANEVHTYWLKVKLFLPTWFRANEAKILLVQVLTPAGSGWSHLLIAQFCRNTAMGHPSSTSKSQQLKLQLTEHPRAAFLPPTTSQWTCSFSEHSNPEMINALQQLQGHSICLPPLLKKLPQRCSARVRTSGSLSW